MCVYHHYHHPHQRYLSSRAEAVSELEIDELLQEFEPPMTNGSSSNSNSNASPDRSGDKKLNPIEIFAHAGKELAVDLRPWMNRAPLTETEQNLLLILADLGVMYKFELRPPHDVYTLYFEH